MCEFINTMKGLSDPSRVKIIKLLQGRELCGCHITQVLGLAQSTTSKHLKTLLAAGLVACTKEGLNRDLEAGAILEGGWLEEFKKRPGSPRQSETASSEKSAQAVDTEVCYGIPFQVIARLIRERDAQLVVMGERRAVVLSESFFWAGSSGILKTAWQGQHGG